MNFFSNYINNNEDTTHKNILTAYAIVITHIFLLFGVGLAILFFKGFYIYIGWILAGIGLFALGVCFFVYHRLTRSTSDIRKVISMPEFENRSLEIKLFGGIAAFKISPEQSLPPGHAPNQLGQLHQAGESQAAPQALPASSKLLLTDSKPEIIEDKIMKLISLFEKNLITEDEFKKAKNKVIEENI